MRIAILELLALPTREPVNLFYHLLLTKQFVSVMPQAVSVWCRQLGHDVHYATYYGIGDPIRSIPDDAELVFLSCYTQVSPIAYALAKILRARGVRVVLAGPHTKAFPWDAVRFADLAVMECDRDLVKEIIAGDYAPRSVVTSTKPLRELPSVEQRMPEIRRSAFFFGRWRLPTTTIALLSSLGCPYSCNFCVDWNNQYRLLPADRLIEDLRFIARSIPRALIAFHDPNFAIKFDATLSAMEEALPPQARLPYMMESSLSVLKPDRMARLAATNCVFVAPGIESWAAYSNKSGGASEKRGAAKAEEASGLAKVESVAAQFRELHCHVTSLQGNLIFGLDTDAGDGPVDLTKRFMDLAPFVWPTLNIPVPFGGTPLFDAQKKADRILEAMPFRFYYAPYSVTKIRNYDPTSYYRRLIELFEYASSPSMLRRRLASRRMRTEKAVDVARTWSTRNEIAEYRRILRVIETDAQVRAFHEGERRELPDFYQHEYRRGLGRYADVLTEAERRPVLDQFRPLPERKARAAG